MGSLAGLCMTQPHKTSYLMLEKMLISEKNLVARLIKISQNNYPL